MASGFAKCISILTSPPEPGTFDEDRFFAHVSNVFSWIPANHLCQELAKARLAEEKSHLFQILLAPDMMGSRMGVPHGVQ